MFAVAAAALVAELLIFLPLELGVLVKLNAKIVTMKKDLAMIKQEWPRRETFLTQNETLGEENKQLIAKYISADQESSLLSFISALGKEKNVEIKSLRPGKLQAYVKGKLGTFSYFPVDVEGQSGFHNLALLLQEAQRSRYFFDVLELSVTSGERTNDVQMVLCGLEKE
ncbi:MAG: hypothetical protein ABH865_06495 [Candidatus Omnitrophota bacterium]